MMRHRVEAHQCPVHRWTTEIYLGRCGVRDESGTICGERFAATYTFMPLHEHDEALCDLSAATSPQQSAGRSQIEIERDDALALAIEFEVKYAALKLQQSVPDSGEGDR